MRRLFSTFANGWPGSGLLLMRLVAGVGLIDRAVMSLLGPPMDHLATLSIIAAVGGLFLLVGLWTPIAGTLVAIVEVSRTSVEAGDPWTYVLLATLAAALALLGPGAWSVDARLFGWKRLDIRSHKGRF